MEIRELALQLPLQERARLAHDLLISLEEATEPPKDVEAAWLEEIEARAEAYEAGTAKAEDWEVSLDRVRKRLREGRSQ